MGKTEQTIAILWLVLAGFFGVFIGMDHLVAAGDPCIRGGFPLVHQRPAGTKLDGGMMCGKDGEQVEDPKAFAELTQAREEKMSAADRRQVDQITKTWVRLGETHHRAVELALDEVEAFSTG